MAKYVMIVLVGPNEGQEATFDDWHEQVHMPEILKTKGFVGAQRYHFAPFQLSSPDDDAPSDADGPERVAPWPYLVVYEIETDDLESVIDGIGAGPAPLSPPPEGAPDPRREGYFFFYQASSVQPKDALAAARRARAFGV